MISHNGYEFLLSYSFSCSYFLYVNGNTETVNPLETLVWKDDLVADLDTSPTEDTGITMDSGLRDD